MKIKFTLIIPIFNEAESIFSLLKEIESEFKGMIPEVLIVDDGSKDYFSEKFKEEKLNTNIKLCRHKTNMGKCKAMLSGVKKASNQLIAIIDGDGQNPPSEVKKLILSWKKESKVSSQNLIICGNRIKREDTYIKRFSSKVANSLRKKILNDMCNDTACALKLFKKKDYLKITYFKNMHRFLPALFIMNGGKVINVPVIDRPRTKGKSKYNFNNRFWVGIIDLLKVWFLIKKKGRVI